VAKARVKTPDLVVLDWMLPDIPGVEVCRQLKSDPATSHIPVLMLTARAEVENRVEGLEAGAEDYVVKPFSMRELILRIQALLKRSAAPSVDTGSADIQQFGPLKVDDGAHRAWIDDKELDLTALEFKLLCTLLERRGRVQSREILLRDVWGYEGGLQTRTVDTNMKRLRQKLGEHGEWIRTIRGVGYRFNEAP
jgi:two-component system phosphate regulon response regulator PhoB